MSISVSFGSATDSDKESTISDADNYFHSCSGWRWRSSVGRLSLTTAPRPVAAGINDDTQSIKRLQCHFLFLTLLLNGMDWIRKKRQGETRIGSRKKEPTRELNYWDDVSPFRHLNRARAPNLYLTQNASSRLRKDCGFSLEAGDGAWWKMQRSCNYSGNYNYRLNAHYSQRSLSQRSAVLSLNSCSTSSSTEL